MKQIRPNQNDVRNLKDQETFDHRVPTFRDYFTGYMFWFFALLIPGLHHFYLGNTWRGVKYLFTLNEVMAGWFLDLFEMHVLIQKSVQEYGHIRHICCTNCMLDNCCYCCCCASDRNTPQSRFGSVAEEAEVINATPNPGMEDDAVPVSDNV